MDLNLAIVHSAKPHNPIRNTGGFIHNRQMQTERTAVLCTQTSEAFLLANFTSFTSDLNSYSLRLSEKAS
jgi:hypothetical protein